MRYSDGPLTAPLLPSLLRLLLLLPVPQADTGGRGVVGLCGPTGRGALIMASTQGAISLLDPRAGYRPEHSLVAHGGGFAALDAQGDLLATSGFSNRMGRVALDTYAKVGGRESGGGGRCKAGGWGHRQELATHSRRTVAALDNACWIPPVGPGSCLPYWPAG